ncbi:hypothetical protein [Nocardia sp. NPDC058497]|uniref:hypothetical protein n=1 Tax=Nocardia sp. NPDC058497 TaxID=3346529 RepID=UPI00365E4E49
MVEAVIDAGAVPLDEFVGVGVAEAARAQRGRDSGQLLGTEIFLVQSFPVAGPVVAGDDESATPVEGFDSRFAALRPAAPATDIAQCSV